MAVNIVQVYGGKMIARITRAWMHCFTRPGMSILHFMFKERSRAAHVKTTAMAFAGAAAFCALLLNCSCTSGARIVRLHVGVSVAYLTSKVRPQVVVTVLMKVLVRTWLTILGAV